MSMQVDLPGDGNWENTDSVEPDGWNEAKTLLATLDDLELADPDLSSEMLLFRLYHETGVRVFTPMPMTERCSCSADGIEAMLATSFTDEDREEMAVDGQIEVVCEFCSTAYHFNPHQFSVKH